MPMFDPRAPRIEAIFDQASHDQFHLAGDNCHDAWQGTRATLDLVRRFPSRHPVSDYPDIDVTVLVPGLPCEWCGDIGMGQAPAIGQNSLRTVPRNFPGRSGTREDRVWLCSPETAAASALAGRIADPRALAMPCPRLKEPDRAIVNAALLKAPPLPEEARKIEVVKGPNIMSLPEFDALPDDLTLPVLLKMGDNVSTDEIMPAGAHVLPYRSNIQKISEFSFERIDRSYVERARAVEGSSGHAVVGGGNYGQGSSREHAAIAPRYLGMRLVLVKSFARIHRQNLINYGVLPLVFADPTDYDRLEKGDVLLTTNLRTTLERGEDISLHVEGKNTISTRHGLTAKQIQIVLAGGLINWRRNLKPNRP